MVRACKSVGRVVALVAAIGAIGLGTPAVADPQIPGMNLRTTVANNMVTVIDLDGTLASGLIVPNLQPLWEPEFSGYLCTPAVQPALCPPDGWQNGCVGIGCPPPDLSRVDVTPVINVDTTRRDGFDASFTFTNTTNSPGKLGSIFIGGMRLPRTIQIRDFFVDGKLYPISNLNGAYYGGGSTYPGSSYSPTAILDPGPDFPYVIGVSVKYPILTYKHGVWIRVESPGGQFTNCGTPGQFGCPNWQVNIELNPWCAGGTDHALHSPEGDLRPGETRRYEVSLRVIKRTAEQHPGAWLRTLLPYREYFHELFGTTDYFRDPRPMCGTFLAIRNGAASCTAENPRAFLELFPWAWTQPTRADIHGWTGWVPYLEDLDARGYKRVTIWAPTGMFCTYYCDNFPFLFTSGWDGVPALRATEHLFRQYTAQAKASGREVGLWWGNSAGFTDQWDAEHVVPLNPFDGDLSDDLAAYAELDGAVSAGVNVVGLDAFIAMPQWRAYDWLKRMQRRQPGVRFVTEAMASDFLHTIAPSYILATRPNSSAGYRVTDPHHLADFLNPRHEIWGQIGEQHIKEELGLNQGVNLTPEQVRPVIRRIAQLGYTPHPFSNKSLDLSDLSQYDAVKSWLTSVPTELQLCTADFNLVGGVTTGDIFDYLNAWFAGRPRADADESGRVDINDVFVFLNAWFAGC